MAKIIKKREKFQLLNDSKFADLHRRNQTKTKERTMTTAHRPQLEARRGGKFQDYVPTSIEHARLLPGHKEMKERKPKSSTAKQESQPSSKESGTYIETDVKPIDETVKESIINFQNIKEEEVDQIAADTSGGNSVTVKQEENYHIQQPIPKSGWRNRKKFNKKVSKPANSRESAKTTKLFDKLLQ